MVRDGLPGAGQSCTINRQTPCVTDQLVKNVILSVDMLAVSHKAEEVSTPRA